MLANPDVILKEMKEVTAQEDTDAEEIERLERELEMAEQREKKLLKLFMLEDLSEEALHEEAANLKRQREQAEERLQILRRTRSDARDPVDTARLCLIGRAIEAWLDDAGEEQWTLVLEALQVSIEATRQRGILRGILPGEVPKFITIEQTSACSFQSANEDTPFWSLLSQ